MKKSIEKETVLIEENNFLIKYKLSSSIKEINQTMDHFRSFFTSRLGGKEYCECEIVIRELLNNAFDHGNHKNPSKYIECQIYYEEKNVIKFVVEDQGGGFKYSDLNIEEPKDPRHINNRGYYLISSLTKDLIFNEKGNKITAFVGI